MGYTDRYLRKKVYTNVNNYKPEPLFLEGEIERQPVYTYSANFNKLGNSEYTLNSSNNSNANSSNNNTITDNDLEEIGKDPNDETKGIYKHKTNGKVYRKNDKGEWEEYPQEGDQYKEDEDAGARGISGPYIKPTNPSAGSKEGSSASPPPPPPPSAEKQKEVTDPTQPSLPSEQQQNTSPNNKPAVPPLEPVAPPPTVVEEKPKKEGIIKKIKNRILQRKLGIEEAPPNTIKKQPNKPNDQSNNQKETPPLKPNDASAPANSPAPIEQKPVEDQNSSNKVQESRKNPISEPTKIEPIKSEKITPPPSVINPKEKQEKTSIDISERERRKYERQQRREERRTERQARKDNKDTDASGSNMGATRGINPNISENGSASGNVDIKAEPGDLQERQINSNSKYTFPPDATDIDWENGTYKDKDGNLRAAPEKKKEIEDKVNEEIEAENAQKSQDAQQPNRTSEDRLKENENLFDTYADNGKELVKVKSNGDGTYTGEDGKIYTDKNNIQLIPKTEIEITEKRLNEKEVERIEKREEEIDTSYKEAMAELDEAHNILSKGNLRKGQRRRANRKLRRAETEFARRYFGVYASSDLNKKKLFGKAKRTPDSELTDYDRKNQNYYSRKQTEAKQFTKTLIDRLTDPTYNSYASKENTNAFLKNFKELKKVGKLFRIPRRSDREVVYNIFNDIYTGKGDWLKYDLKHVARPIDKMRINRIVRRNDRFEKRLERRANRNNN